MKTKAVVFPGADRYEIRELTLDAPGPDDIVVRTLVSAISPGTERWILRGKHLGTRFPCTPGYQRIGVVEERGRNVAAFEVGDVVYGSGNRWKEQDVITMWGAHVGRSVSACDGYHFLASAVPSAFELETTAFTVVAGVAARGVRFCDPRTHQTVLIVGAGFIGLCAAQLAGLRGARTMLIEKDEARAALARRIAPSVLSPDARDLEAQLKAFAPAGFDVLYDTVGHAGTTDALVPHVRLQGTLLLQAQYFDRETCAINLDQVKIREITMKTTCGIDEQDWQETLTNIRARRLGIGSMITHRFRAPDELLKGYTVLDKGVPVNLGIVFQWTEG